MFCQEKGQRILDHLHITIFGDNQSHDIEKTVQSFFAEFNVLTITPKDAEGLKNAAENSVLVIIALYGNNDPNFALGEMLQKEPLIISDVIAIFHDGTHNDVKPIMYEGFDNCFAHETFKSEEFRKFLLFKIKKGSQRLTFRVRNHEYKRFRDALSASPGSVVVFDSDKRIVFISDHYHRAYPEAAGKIKPGLSVYEAFDIMAPYDSLAQDTADYNKAKEFWYSMNGELEIIKPDGKTYLTKATPLPDGQGTIVTTINITKYR